MERVGEHVHRLGSRWINWYLVDDGGELTLIDTGCPRYYGQLRSGLASTGRVMGPES